MCSMQQRLLPRMLQPLPAPPPHMLPPAPHRHSKGCKLSLWRLPHLLIPFLSRLLALPLPLARGAATRRCFLARLRRGWRLGWPRRRLARCCRRLDARTGGLLGIGGQGAGAACGRRRARWGGSAAAAKLGQLCSREGEREAEKEGGR